LLSAVILFIITSLSMQVLDEAEVSLAHEQSNKANYLAEACAEYVLLKLSNDSSYDVDDELTLDDETCSYVIDGEYPDKIIRVTSVVGDHSYTAEMEIEISTTTPSVTIESFNRNADF